MTRKVLFAKLHMATCTDVRPEYSGSLTVDADLLDATGLRNSDAVVVANCRSGARFETYLFRGERGSKEIVVNGAAAHLAEKGDRLIILHYAFVNDAEYAEHRPTVLIMNPDNTVGETIRYEPD